MQFDNYQQKIIDTFTSTKDNLSIIARAGSGKTTILTHLASVAPELSEVYALAFNKHIAETMKARMPSTNVATFHSLCLSAIRRQAKVKIETRKALDTIRQMIPSRHKDIHYEANRQLDLARANCAGLDDDYDWESQLSAAPLTDDEQAVLASYLPKVLERLQSETYKIDFNDMLEIPFLRNISLPQPDILLVDEAQDLNPIQHRVIEKLSPRRLIICGDPRQSIYAFRGAATNSMDLLAETHSATQLLMPISYRCSKAVIRAAQGIVPDIQAAPAATDGEVIHTHVTPEYNEIPARALFLCRNNGPLFSFGLYLFRHKVPMRIRTSLGRYILSRLSKHKRTTPISKFLRLLEIEINQAPKKKQAALDELYTTYASLAEDKDLSTVGDLLDTVKSLLSADGGVTLSTIHRAKGDEADFTYILYPELMPSKFATTEEDFIQEDNLRYVAYTRAKLSLTLIGGNNA